MRISIVIPILNEADELPTLVRSLRDLDGAAEVLFVDGGSMDGSPSLVQTAGYRLLEAAPGRGRQMNAGAWAGRLRRRSPLLARRRAPAPRKPPGCPRGHERSRDGRGPIRAHLPHGDMALPVARVVGESPISADQDPHRRPDDLRAAKRLRRVGGYREVYLHTAGVVGVEPARLAHVAAHVWDVVGASRAGLLTGWVARQEKRFHRAMGAPTVQGQSLVDVIEALLGLPA